VVLLNALYQGGIINTYRMAEHIVEQRIDKKLQIRDITVIEDIRKGHGIRTKGMSKDLDF
jgi:hypothetical protein